MTGPRNLILPPLAVTASQDRLPLAVEAAVRRAVADHADLSPLHRDGVARAVARAVARRLLELEREGR